MEAQLSKNVLMLNILCLGIIRKLVPSYIQNQATKIQKQKFQIFQAHQLVILQAIISFKLLLYSSFGFDHIMYLTKLWITFSGYKKVAESLKPTAASYSFGKKHAHIARNDTVGPGPANYDVSGLSTKGKQTKCL